MRTTVGGQKCQHLVHTGHSRDPRRRVVAGRVEAGRYETFDQDVLVIGAGGAGLRAAIAAAASGLSVTLVCKSLLSKAHTGMAEGGIAAALGNVDPQDGWQVHFADTMRGGQMINDYRMVEIFAKEAPERVYELERWGGLFDRTPDGKILQRPFGAHTYRRLCHVGDRTGLELIRTLQDKAVHSGIVVHMEVTFTRLLRDAERIAGAFGYRREDGRFVVFKAKAVILGTGGWGKVYKVTSNSWECTGDGCAMAFEAGAELRSEERRVGKSVDLGGGSGIRKRKDCNCSNGEVV